MGLRSGDPWLKYLNACRLLHFQGEICYRFTAFVALVFPLDAFDKAAGQPARRPFFVIGRGDLKKHK
jgi:hypothetical protein